MLPMGEPRSLSVSVSSSPVFSDACTSNFLMKSDEVYPNGYLFAESSTLDSMTPAPFVHRCRVRSPMRYYIADFEGSCHYPDGHAHALSDDVRCQIDTSPEWNGGLPHNPFLLDVYNVGATFLRICKVCPIALSVLNSQDMACISRMIHIMVWRNSCPYSTT